MMLLRHPSARPRAARPAFALFGALIVAALLLDIRYNPAGETSLSFTLAEILAWSLLAISFLMTGPEKLFYQIIKPAFAVNPYAVLWTSWAVLASLTSLLLLGRFEGLQLAKDMMPGFIAFLFLSSAVVRGRDWRHVRLALLIGIMTLGALGTAQFLFGGPYLVAAAEVAFQKLNIEGNFIGTPVVGLSQHPNNFGQFLAPGLAFALVLLIYHPSRLNPLLWGAILLGAVALYGTAMKGAFFWVPVGLAAAFIPRKFIKGPIIVALVVFMGVALVEYSLAQRAHIASTMETRMILWHTTIENLQSPTALLIGGDLQQVAYDNFGKISWEFPHSHMTYLNNALYFGLPALILYLGALYRGIVVAARGAATLKSPAIAAYARAALAALVTIAGLGILESTVEPARFGILYIMMGIVGALAHLIPADRERSRAVRVRRNAPTNGRRSQSAAPAGRL